LISCRGAANHSAPSTTLSPPKAPPDVSSQQVSDAVDPSRSWSLYLSLPSADRLLRRICTFSGRNRYLAAATVPTHRSRPVGGTDVETIWSVIGPHFEISIDRELPDIEATARRPRGTREQGAPLHDAWNLRQACLWRLGSPGPETPSIAGKAPSASH
jgi:hypothetical protein